MSARRLARWRWLAALLFAACGRPGPPGAGKTPARVYTPAQTLYELKLAYNTPDLNLARQVFHSAEFSYTPENPPAGFPRPWRYDDEIAATAALFADAYHIVLDFDATPAAVGSPAPGATRYVTKPLEVTARVWRDPAFCFYARGFVTFTLARAHAAERWRVVGIVDRTGPASAAVKGDAETAVCSWADIKYFYLKRGRAGGGA